MFRKGVLSLPAPALAGFTFVLTALPASGWELGGPLYTRNSHDPYSPSQYGYNLDEQHPGYYGGGRYREYYNFGRGFGWAEYPGRIPEPYYWRPYHGYHPPVTDFPAAPAALVPVGPPPLTTVPTHCAHLEIRVPDAAEVYIEGKKTAQNGAVRTFDSPALEPGEKYVYRIRAKWQGDEQTQEVNVRAGERVVVQFPTGPELGSSK